MNKRLRKKKYRGEFAVYGFDVEIEVAGTGDSLAFWDEWIELVESRNLQGGGISADGGENALFDLFVAHVRRYHSPTADDQAAMAAWLAQHPRVIRYRVGPMLDAYRYTGDKLTEHLALPWMPGPARDVSAGV